MNPTDNPGTGPATDGLLARVHIIEDGRYKGKEQAIDPSKIFPSGTRGGRWIHVPVNDLDWVNQCFRMCRHASMSAEIGRYKMRPIFLEKPGADGPGNFVVPEHAKHLEPSCTPGSHTRSTLHSASPLYDTRREENNSPDDMPWLPLLTVYFPYMSWMTYGKYQNPRTKYGSSNHATITSKTEFSAEEKETPSKDQKSSSVSKILTSWPLVRTIKRPQYLRRTLDQFYYPSLTNTSARDKDQTISKWSGTPLEQHGRNEAATDSAMIMVDQFWCWIIDKNTIITSFPSGIYSDSPSGVQDLYLGIVKSLTNHPQQLETVEDMYSLLIKEAAGYMFNGVNMSSVDMMGIYRWVTGDKAATQTTYFQEFQKGYASGGHDKTIFNDRHDLKLVLEVADIIDELKMIQHLLNTQKDVIQSSNMALQTSTLQHHVNEIIEPLLAQFAKISDEAEHTRTMLFNLLELKSNAASLVEAQVATTQGRAVMLFTIITVIFLPLSFFTSYFGQNVRELTRDEGNPSTWHLWRIATPITVVVIVLSLLIAYYITRLSSPLGLRKARMSPVSRWWRSALTMLLGPGSIERNRLPDPERTV